MATITPSFRATERAAPRIHLPFLDGLRGLAALQIVLFHFIGLGLSGAPRLVRYGLIWTTFGHAAVDVFIVLSGFSLMLPVARSADLRFPRGIRDYFMRRSRRILPPYFFAILFSLLVLAVLHMLGKITEEQWQASVAPADIVSHILLIHNLSRQWQAGINMALWSVATEWQIYFFFPFLLLPLWRRWGNLTVVAAAFVIGVAPHFVLPQRLNIDFACPWYLGLFALGMVAAVISSSRPCSELWTKRLLATAIVSAVCYVLAKFGSPSHLEHGISQGEWLKDGIGGVLVWSMILHSALYEMRPPIGSPSLLMRLLNSRAAVGLGAFSYSLYLTHCAILEVLEAVVETLHLPPMMALALMAGVGIPLALYAAYLFYLAFERPFVRRQHRSGGISTIQSDVGSIQPDA